MNWVLPTVIVAMLLGIGLNLVAAFIFSRAKKGSPPTEASAIDPKIHKEIVDKLNTCESLVKHWKDEVRKVSDECEGQKKIRDDRLSESEGKSANLEQKLRVAQDKLDEFTIPRGRLKIKRAEYNLPGKVGLDVTETLDKMVLDEKLVIAEPYQRIFFPDPFPRIRKQLVVEFSHGRNEFSVTVPEDTKLTLPFPYGEIKY